MIPLPFPVRAIIGQLVGLPETKVINHDSAVLRALVTENTELRRQLGLPLVSTVVCTDGTFSTITRDLPARVWESRVN